LRIKGVFTPLVNPHSTFLTTEHPEHGNRRTDEQGLEQRGK